jgi:heptosyltransferase II
LSDAQARAPTRTLVIAPQWIGDAVMAEPLLATLAERGEVITVAALPWVAAAFAAMPEVQATIELPFSHGRLDWRARRRVAASLRDRFEVAYVLPNSLKAALVPWLARIPRRVGYRGEARGPLLTERHERPRGRPPMVPFYGALAGDAFDPARRPRLQLPRERIEATAATHALPSAYWTFAPGAEYGPAKRWPVEHYAALARALYGRDAMPVVLLGSPGESTLCDEIAAQSAGACRVLAGRTSLADALALIAGSRGLASNDSGLMHVAAGFGIPQVAIFGSTSPLHTPPLNDRARVLWLKDELQLDCMPCFDRTCRFGHTRCLVDVPPERVEAALLDAARA